MVTVATSLARGKAGTTNS